MVYLIATMVHEGHDFENILDMEAVGEVHGDIDFFNPLRDVTREQAMAILRMPIIDSTGHQIVELAKPSHYLASMPGLRESMAEKGVTFDELLYLILEMRKSGGGKKPMSFAEIAKDLGVKQIHARALHDKAASKMAMYENRRHFRSESHRRKGDI